MSRGLGKMQCRLLDVLKEAPADEGLSVVESKSRVGGERSNVRRAVLTLALRGLVEELTVGGERRVRLTFWGALAAMPPLEPEDPLADLKARRVRWAEEARERALKEERAREEARLETLKEPLCDEYAPRIIRRRRGRSSTPRRRGARRRGS